MSIILCWIFQQYTFAESRNLPGVTIITRAERWADESMGFSDHPSFVALKQEWEKSALKYELLKLTDPKLYQKKEDEKALAKKKNDIRNNFLNTNYWWKFRNDKVITKIDERDLRRNRKYNYQKTEIIIHHTVTNTSALTTLEKVKAELRNIHKYHALTRQRWDIWYNFIIGPQWDIFEGRAGWESIIWAHSEYNNNPSIWISLMGNFEETEPSKEQIDSLIKLSTSLAIKYNIDPYKSMDYHRTITSEPYIETLSHDSIVWHTDTWRTACPGKNLNDLIPNIKAQIAINIKNKASTISNPISPSIKKITNSITKVTYNEEFDLNYFWNIEIPNATWATWTQKCLIIKDKKLASTCRYKNENIVSDSTDLEWGDYVIFIIKWYRQYTLAYTTIKKNKLTPINVSPAPKSLEELKSSYLEDNNIILSTKNTTKFKSTIDSTQAKELMKKDISVLLYEASTSLQTYDISCEKCIISSDTFNGETNSLRIIKNKDSLSLLINNTQYETSWISISTPKLNDTITINNYKRASYAGIPWNSFFWKIIITKDFLPTNNWVELKDFLMINTVNLNQYLAWIVESNDTESLEQNKTMSILAKNYILFYIDQNNIHPSIHPHASYNAIDHPDYFQKYVWAWLTKTLKKRFTALTATNNQYLAYNWNLAFTPYFSCSAWFTRSAKEKRWRTDTPYLVSQKDLVACDDFSWHWVWLSGRGASQLANNWKWYTEILDFYYPWTKLVKID